LGQIQSNKRDTFLRAVVSSGAIEDAHAASAVSKLIRHYGVVRSNEFERIAKLPRREWEKDPSIEEARAGLEEWLRLPNSVMRLWDTQVVALIEMVTTGGFFGPIGVGRGKALISLLAPVVLGAERPLLLVPAQLRDQTLRKVIPEMRKHWRLHSGLQVRGYSELSLAKNKDMLFRLKPDLIVLDEAHAVKAPSTARTKRLKEYLRENQQVRVAAMSGTVTRKSLKDYWHLLLWALKGGLAPMPRTWREMACWADALDADVQVRAEPGALLELCDPANPKETARDGYRRRLVQTLGVVATSESELGVSLSILRRPLRLPDDVGRKLAQMRATWETPNGDTITEAVELWRHARELACGFFYKWQPPAPEDWLEARKAWKRYVRDTLEHNRRGLDSELLVAGDAERQDPQPSAWREWREIRDSFKPNTVPEWLSDFALEDAISWMRDRERDGEGGICWIEHIAVGERLAALSGYPYFGAGMGASANILDARGPVIASIRAHSEGKNLQHWSKNLLVSCPPSGKTFEQLLGRTHRPGQLADEVCCEIYLHTDELAAGFDRARADARYIEETTGARQKLLYANVDV
jgi:hypothetical protein